MAALLLACALAAIGTVFDLRSRRIPNALTYPSFLLALVAHFFLHGWNALVPALGCALVAAIIFGSVYAVGGIGGGDVKLAMALGALLADFDATLRLFLLTTIFGALLALIAAWRGGQLHMLWRRLWSKQARQQTAPMTIAYGPAFLLGALASLGLSLMR